MLTCLLPLPGTKISLMRGEIVLLTYLFTDLFATLSTILAHKRC